MTSQILMGCSYLDRDLAGTVDLGRIFCVQHGCNGVRDRELMSRKQGRYGIRSSILRQQVKIRETAAYTMLSKTEGQISLRSP